MVKRNQKEAGPVMNWINETETSRTIVSNTYIYPLTYTIWCSFPIKIIGTDQADRISSWYQNDLRGSINLPGLVTDEIP